MARFTKSEKQAFVLSVLSDVPSVDYATLMRELCTSAAVNQLPKEVRAVWDNPKLRDWVATSYTAVYIGKQYIHALYVPQLGGSVKLSPADEERLLKLKDAATAQNEARRQLKETIESTIAGFNTTKQAREALPEFAKYLPDEVAPTKNLPSVTGMVTALVEAGWPDKGAPEPKKAARKK